jgi:hypothetical protein
LALGVPDHALRQSEERELGVDVRSRTQDALEAYFMRRLQKVSDVEPRVAPAKVVLTRRGLVHAPRHVRVHEM